MSQLNIKPSNWHAHSLIGLRCTHEDILDLVDYLVRFKSSFEPPPPPPPQKKKKKKEILLLTNLSLLIISLLFQIYQAHSNSILLKVNVIAF